MRLSPGSCKGMRVPFPFVLYRLRLASQDWGSNDVSTRNREHDHFDGRVQRSNRLGPYETE